LSQFTEEVAVPDFNRTELSTLPINIAINALLEAHVSTEATRGYLGASAVGHSCLRKMQYDWLCDPVHPLRLRDIFDRGHFFEAQSRAHFERSRFVFADKERLAFEALGGWLRGHADGIFVAGPKLPSGAGYPCLWEHKAVYAKGWRGVERDGLEKTYPAYAAQIGLYQRFLGVDEHPAIVTVVNSDTCDRLHLLVPFDAERTATWIARAQTVIDATRAGELLSRLTNHSDDWRCKMCGHRERCWRT
jgi:hypothetical protein